MMPFSIAANSSGGIQLLLLGAHCDDIEIGCGGTLLKLMEHYTIRHVQWVVFSSNPARKKEALNSAEAFTASIEDKNIQIHDYEDGFLPSVWSEVKREFEAIKSSFTPDIILTHYRNDLHQDHRVINELTWNIFRDHLIFEYEIPKYDGDLGNPNVFVPLKGEYLERKKEILLTTFKSQLDKQWFDESLIMSIPRIRGVQCASASNYAEAFYGRKMVL
jgi:LmbE family N-acetylglucosaminyl deacetylase